MQTVDEQPETIHLYVVREKEPKPSVFPIVLSTLSLIVLLVFCVLVPYQQPVTRAVIRVPAVLLPIQTFNTSVAIVPTSLKTYPALFAHGTLTVTNGSVISQELPKNFIISANNGVTVATDSAAYIPPGNANGYGWAQVRAHALVSGRGGNLPPYSINSVIGSSVYVRNLSAFSGGKDSYAVKLATAQDKQTALIKARNILAVQINGLHYSCQELYLQNALQIKITWRCQFLTYHIPAFYHVTEIKIVGKNLLISIWFVARPVHIWVK